METINKPSIILMTPADLPQVLRIESESFEDPWSESDFRNVMSEPKTRGQVAMIGGRVVGYAVYMLRKREIIFQNMAVDQAFRRQGIASEFIELIKRELVRLNRPKIVDLVAEENLVMHLFLKSHGFIASVDEDDREFYRFEWTKPLFDCDL